MQKVEMENRATGGEFEPTPGEYNAASIRVLSDAEIVERFEWTKLGHLAAQYKRDPDFIRRGIQACEHVGISADYFIRRYLDGDKTVQLREDVDTAFRDLFLKMAKG